MLHQNLIKFIALTLLAVLPMMANGCGVVTGLLTSEEVSLEYAGQIEFGSPQRDGKSIKIPVTFNGGKWHENSGIIFKQFNVAQAEHTIYITVVTCLAGGDSNASLPTIKLQNLEAGVYQVRYKNPDGTHVLLKTIEL